jgi:nicotinamidase-related amidase
MSSRASSGASVTRQAIWTGWRRRSARPARPGCTWRTCESASAPVILRSARNKTFAAIASSSAFTDEDPAAGIHPAIAPDPHDLVITKRRVSAFAGSDLEVLLRGLGASTLVLAGIATSGVVLSTVRQAADLDYGIVVLADGCLDPDREVHRVLTEKVFPRHADVLTVAEWSAGLARQAD